MTISDYLNRKHLDKLFFWILYLRDTLSVVRDLVLWFLRTRELLLVRDSIIFELLKALIEFELIFLGCMKLAMARLSGGFIDQVVGAKLVEVTDEYIKGVTQEYKARRY